jgi:hypothetical protein
VFHFEPIWDHHDLRRQHSDVLEAIGWIDPTFRNTIELCDRFPEIFFNGRPKIQAEVARNFGTSS